MELIYKKEAYDLIGACFEVYNEMGSGFLEDVYQEALESELGRRSLPFVSKPKLEIWYKGNLLTKKYEPDLVAWSKIIVELKAVSNLTDEHRAQVHNYLKASSFRLGLLVNFGKPKDLQYERIVR
ncbi:GxxExxY protein [Luteolibacter marinus]|uniref:GxxExxY protein n=1 Tax=Luteolibacter marinus TaxID=2776705 RepID=UPI001866E2A1|nr:GxxExxY protein [Luteolibacter marinus]